jgi:hypothetical protein
MANVSSGGLPGGRGAQVVNRGVSRGNAAFGGHPRATRSGYLPIYGEFGRLCKLRAGVDPLRGYAASLSARGV